MARERYSAEQAWMTEASDPCHTRLVEAGMSHRIPRLLWSTFQILKHATLKRNQINTPGGDHRPL
jgi:hypothetical protein